MSYKKRIEGVIADMFQQDREWEARLKKTYPLYKDMPGMFHLQNGCCDFALDLLGIPKDLNSLERQPGECDYRDSFYNMWMFDAKTAQEFIDYCYEALKDLR
tara:strand:- start:345 stop:650 length:306 start_codon:yes stop_codon:yes gene_type:complete